MQDSIESGSSISSGVLRRIRANDQVAWRQLVHKYGPVVYGWCLAAGVSSQDAADIGQDVFEAVSKNLNRFSRNEEDQTFVGWLRQITRFKIADFQRRVFKTPDARGGSTFQAMLSTIQGDEVLDQSTSELSQAEHSLALRGVLDSIRTQVNQQTWSAFWETAVNGRPAGDVADDLGMSAVSVRKAKSRVLRRIRDALADVDSCSH